jgi:hypothetical protein
VGEGLSRRGYPADIKPWLEFLRFGYRLTQRTRSVAFADKYRNSFHFYLAGSDENNILT